MALNLKTSFEHMLPEIDFLITARGITVMCQRINTPRFIPFDIPGKCVHCKSDGVEVDFAVTKDGVTFACPRIKEMKFVAFDFKYDLPDTCIFRVRSKGRVFNIPHVAETMATYNKALTEEEDKAIETLKDMMASSSSQGTIKKTEKEDEI
jgi:hypothetical protein